MAKEPIKVNFLGVEVDGKMYQIGDEDMPEKVHEKTMKAWAWLLEYKKFMKEGEHAG